ncbi:MAG: M15 family metallopeptidase [Brevinematales bacterium]|nr:M15 family metallopeptidase [Brevinematales bacterium]
MGINKQYGYSWSSGRKQSEKPSAPRNPGFILLIAVGILGIAVISFAAFGPVAENTSKGVSANSAPSPEASVPPAALTPDADPVSVVETPADYPKDELLGKINPKPHPSFIAIDQKYTPKTGIYLRKETYAAFIRMHDAAMKEGVKIFIISAFRSFYDQKAIWEQKWNGGKTVAGKNLAKEVPDFVERAKYILLYSSMPGTSRHHWGTDIDLNSLENSYFASGDGKKIYDWLAKHAAEYGFYQPYTPKPSTRATGYEEEKWHWSYLPVAKPMMQSYLKTISYSDINGFLGSETAAKLQVIENYVKGVNPACIP